MGRASALQYVVRVWLISIGVCGLQLPVAATESVEAIRWTAFRDRFTANSGAPLVFATNASVEPIVDGRLDDQAWKAVASWTGFVEHQTSCGKPVQPGQTSVQFTHDDKHLFIAARCQLTAPGMVRHELRDGDRDGDVFTDDCLDIHLHVNGTTMRFIVTAGGARADALDGDPAWNPDWVTAVMVHETEWIAECAIPFSALQGRRPPSPADPGSTLRINVGRATSPVRITSSLFPGYDDPAAMGVLVVGSREQWEARTRSRPGIHIAGVALLLDKCRYDAADGRARGRLRLLQASPAADPTTTEVRARMTILDAEGKPVIPSTTTVGLDSSVIDFDIDTAQLMPGKYRVLVEVVNQDDLTLHKASQDLVRRQDEVAPRAGSIQLNVDIPAESARLISKEAPLPVYAGIPMPRGVADDATSYQVFDAAGRELPCQVDTITRWAPRGSTQWLGLRFMTESSDVGKCTLVYSEGRQAASQARSVRVVHRDDCVVVDTGPLRFEVNGATFNGLHRVWLDCNGDGTLADDEQLLANDPTGPFVCDHNGTAYHARNDPHPEVSVETEGAMCVVVRCEGWYVSADGGRICRHVTRIVAHAGLSWLKVFHTVIFCGDSRETAISDVAWPLTLREAASRVRFGGEARPYEATLSEGVTESLLQHEHDAYQIDQFREGDMRSAKTASTGGIASGWAELISQRTAVSVGLRHFASQYPKELEASRETVTLHIWPRHGIDKATKPPTDDDLSELWFLHHRRLLDFQVPKWFSAFQSAGPFVNAEHEAARHRYVRASANTNGMGTARSHELFINFRTLERDTVRSVWTYNHSPALANASPQWMCATGVFGPIAPVDRDAFPVVEQAIDTRFDGERTIERFSEGMFNAGGSTSYFKPELGSYDQLDRPWRLTHHGAPRAPWLLFARSGQRKYAEYALRNGGWCADLGYCHYSHPALEREGIDGKVRGGQCDYKGIVPWSRGGRVMDYNSIADFLLWMSCFSGDRWPLEVADEWGRCVKRRYAKTVGRNAAGTIDTLLTLYETTWDMDYRELAERQFDAIVESEFQPSGHFRNGVWYDYAPWLSHYHRFTGSERAADVAVRWTRRIMSECWLDDGSFGDDTSFKPAMGYPMHDIFRVAFDATLDRKILDFAYGCGLLPAISTINSPGTAFHGFDPGALGSQGGYYAQTLPSMLPVLREQGHDRAVFPPWSLHARRLQLFIRAPAGAPVELRLRVLPDSRAQEEPPASVLVKMISDRGDVSGPEPLEIVRRAAAGAGQSSSPHVEPYVPAEYARIVVPMSMAGSTVAVVLARAGGKGEVGIQAPIQVQPAVDVVYQWLPGMRFGRGSAIYFGTPPRGTRVNIKADASFYPAPHTVALLDDRDQVRRIGQWQPAPGSSHLTVTAELATREQRQVWCCVQGLTKNLVLEPVDAEIPRVFSDRPERFFVPDGIR